MGRNFPGVGGAHSREKAVTQMERNPPVTGSVLSLQPEEEPGKNLMQRGFRGHQRRERQDLRERNPPGGN